MNDQPLKQENENGEMPQGLKNTAGVVAGAGVGTLAGVAGIATTVALCEIVLPVTLCLFASGLAGGAIGLLWMNSRKRK